jgi:hypothetical protein
MYNVKNKWIMKTKMLVCFSIVFLSFSTVSLAQTSIPFKVRYQGLVKGDMVVIANNIVNRVDYNNSSNDPYYNHTNQAKLNDEFDMEYIDIDKDEDTFSSSSAELFLDNSNNKKIIYAGLYWSATYKYNIGIQKNEDKYIAQDAGREMFNNIKIKLPNKKEYINIVGQTIFDGLKEKEFKEYAPYVAYADITEYVKKLSSLTGVYTVANIKATQGKIEGGVAAGWTIFFIYEDQTMSKKFIKSQDGFSGITDVPTDVLFYGFEIKQEKVTAKIACAALEGDNNLIGDQLLIGNNQTKTFTPLSNVIRKENNFFNSCITIDDQYFSNRFPDSKNTLGYDTFLFSIPNQDNPIISKTSKESMLRFKSTGDKLFLFFCAFQVETEPSLINVTEKTISNQEYNNQTIKLVPMNNDLLVDNNKTTSAINRIQKNNALETNLIEIHTFSSSSIISGYYILANVFKTEQKTQEFIYYLKSKKITADFFINPLNNYYYVYLRMTNNQKEAIELYTSKLYDTYNEPLQIVLINNDENMVVAQKNIDKTEPKIIQNPKIKIEIVSKDVSIKPIEKTDYQNTNSQIEKNVVAEGTKPLTEEKPVEIVKAKVSNDIHIANIPNEPKGYYIVANVFEINENANNFIKKLKYKQLQPKVMINTLNNYKYVYLKRVDSLEEAQSLFDTKFNNKYDSKIWILSVNNLE